MSLKAITTEIQKQTGSAAPCGKFNERTALAVIAALDFDLEDLTEIIQRKVGTIPDGIYGSMTGRARTFHCAGPALAGARKYECRVLLWRWGGTPHALPWGRLASCRSYRAAPVRRRGKCR